MNSTWTWVSSAEPPRKPSLEMPGEPLWSLSGGLGGFAGTGKGNSVEHSETRLWGAEAAQQLATGGRRVVKPEESFLFSLTLLTPQTTFQLEEGV